jgi:hypothetical protein
MLGNNVDINPVACLMHWGTLNPMAMPVWVTDALGRVSECLDTMDPGHRASSRLTLEIRTCTAARLLAVEGQARLECVVADGAGRAEKPVRHFPAGF